MNQPWPKIVVRYEEYTGDDSAIHAMLILAKRIANSPLSNGLFAWTSMYDLCITQTIVTHAYTGPFLKISPLREGRIEFRYLDTEEKEKQWHRTVDASEVVPRLLSFLAQLHWFPPELLQQ